MRALLVFSIAVAAEVTAPAWHPARFKSSASIGFDPDRRSNPAIDRTKGAASPASDPSAVDEGRGFGFGAFDHVARSDGAEGGGGREEEEATDADGVGVVSKYVDAGFAAAGGDARSLRRAPLPGCALHVFRHVSKAAGTTVRFIFDKQVAMGEWEFLPRCHYGFKEADWRDVVRRFRDAALDPDRLTRQMGPRILVEIRNEWGATRAFEDVVLPDLAALRAQTRHLGCSVTSSLLFREPAKQVESFHRYYIEKLQRAPRVGESPREGAWLKGPAAWGEGLAEWAPRVPDPQLRELLGDKCTPRLREPVFDAEEAADLGGGVRRLGDRRLPDECRVTDGDRDRLRAIVNAVDVVGTTERFDLFWMHLADVVGFQHLEYVVSNTRQRGDSGRRAEAEAADDSVNPALSSVAAVEARRNDDWAYGLIRAAQDDQTTCRGKSSQRRPTLGPRGGAREDPEVFDTGEGGAGGDLGDGAPANSSGDGSPGEWRCELPERVRAFKALGGEGEGKARVGGRPPRSTYKLVEATEGKPGAAPEGAWVTPEFFTGAPVCKGFGTSFAALVRHDDAGYRCDRGCSFD